MFLGHFGLALAGKRADPTLPLAALLTASVLPDLLDPALSLAGLDGTMLTHTGPAIAGLALLVGGVARLVTRRWSAALLMAGLTLSHFLADLITSKLDLWSGGPVAGWGLYGRPWINFGLEATLILAGWTLYRATLPASRRGHPVAFGILGVLLALQAAIAAMGVS
jgi:hypothetical protein